MNDNKKDNFFKVNIEDESLQKFKELTQEKGIEEENVVNFIKTGK